MEDVRFILVTGGVMSGVGKGIVSSSIGALLKAAGYRVTAIKIDPYLNVDAGTFSPFEHGEVFVLDDGGEVDLDLGNYERFLGVRLGSDNNITSGKIFQSVINRAKRGDYLGKTVQIVPHVTDEIIEWVERVSKIPVDDSKLQPEICVVELGGTIGDIEISPYTMAFSRATFNRFDQRNRLMSVHVTKLLDEENGEIKTKPAQNSLTKLCENGLAPDLLMCRSKNPLIANTKEKIANFSRLAAEKIIDVHNASSIYEVPLMLYTQNVMKYIQERLNLPIREANIDDWKKLNKRAKKYQLRTSDLSPIDCGSSTTGTLKIALVAKYINANGGKVFTDAYASVVKALQHAGIALGRNVQLLFLNSENLDKLGPEEQKVKECDGILVPGGFGDRGIEGKIEACRIARKYKIPFLGICLGLQCAAIEFARNICGINGANSEEFSNSLNAEQQIVISMPEHAGATHGMAGTQRLGRRTTVFLTEKSIIRELYGATYSVEERHRHRYEVNPTVVPKLSRAGLLFVGMGVDEERPSCATTAFNPNSRSMSAQDLVDSVANNLAPNKEELLLKIDEICATKANGDRATPLRMEMVEMDPKDHPFFVGVQYHPEFLSHPTKPSPIFYGFVKAAGEYLDKQKLLSLQKVVLTKSSHQQNGIAHTNGDGVGVGKRNEEENVVIFTN